MIFLEGRKEANLFLLRILESYMTEYPDLRFSQAVYNLRIVKENPETNNLPPKIENTYMEEPVITLKRVVHYYMLDGNLISNTGDVVSGALNWLKDNGFVV
jgi:hypothetical protein